MLSLLAILAVSGPALVLAQDVWRCDTTMQPDYENCDSVEALIPWNSGDDATGDSAPIPDGECRIFSTPGNAGNCIIAACNNRGDGAPQALNVFSGHAYYDTIKTFCAPDKAGASRVKRGAIGEVTSQDITIEEAQALAEEPTKLRQRQDPTWTNIATSLNIRTDKRDQLSAASSSGSSQQWSTSKGFSSSVSSTVEVGASFFDIFSASVSLTVTLDYSESFTETLTFDPSGKCEQDQRAILYIYPLFDKYTGFYSDRPDEVIDWFIPVGGDNNYEIVVECLG